MEERLQKLMAQAGVGSRRENEKLIEAGRVRVNGRIAKLGDKADPNRDRIEVSGRLLKLRKQEFVYVALNKPKGVLSSLEDELGEGRKTVRDLIPISGHLYPVGRLDKQSEGLMLMTNDGDLAHQLTHPRYGHEKVYHVVVEGNLPDSAITQWEEGIYLDGRKTMPAKIELVRRQREFTQLKVTLREGRKRQIRRIANILGYSVRELVRQQIGPLKLGDLKPGQWRYLQPAEISALQKSVRRAASQKRSSKSTRPKQARPVKRGKRIGKDKPPARRRGH